MLSLRQTWASCVGMQVVTSEVRDRHIAKCKEELEEKVQTPRAGMKNAAVKEDNEDSKSIALIDLKAIGMPSREELLKSLGYQGMNIVLGNAESDGGYKGILSRIGMLSQGPCKSKQARLKLYDWKLYLDSCATYHTVFTKWCLDNVHEVKAYLKGHCNTGVTICKEQGYYEVFKMRLNCNGIENLLLSIPQL